MLIINQKGRLTVQIMKFGKERRLLQHKELYWLCWKKCFNSICTQFSTLGNCRIMVYVFQTPTPGPCIAKRRNQSGVSQFLQKSQQNITVRAQLKFYTTTWAPCTPAASISASCRRTSAPNWIAIMIIIHTFPNSWHAPSFICISRWLESLPRYILDIGTGTVSQLLGSSLPSLK